jgi:hypothetical protein
MRGNCSIKECSNKDMTVKIHERFEDSEINICWSCGDILLKALEKDDQWGH